MATQDEASLGVPSNVLAERVKHSVFTVAHAICERGVHHRVTTLGQWLALGLLLIDLIQAAALPVTSQFGYSDEAVAVAQGVSIKHLILGYGGSRFGWGYALVAVLVWALLGGLLFLRAVLMSGPLTRAWPMMAVRLLIGLLVQVGFVPVVHVLLTPFSCTEMRLVHSSGLECHGGAHILMLVTSIVTAVPFVLTALTLRLLVHESDPNAVDVKSMVCVAVGMRGCCPQVANDVALLAFLYRQRAMGTPSADLLLASPSPQR